MNKSAYPKIIMLLLCTIFSKFSFAQNEDNESFNKNPISNMRSGVKYSYTENFYNPSCSNSENHRCINLSQYRTLCKSAKYLTKDAVNFRYSGKVSDSEADFIDAASLDWNIQWLETTKGGLCYVSVTAIGVYKGSSKKLVIDGDGYSFIKSSDGNILITRIN
jgi:hypothetical protein